jgi:hypothetical protein
MTASPHSRETVEQLRAALDAAQGLPAFDVDGIEVFIKPGEWELALDTLCTQIDEYGIPVDATQMARLDHLGAVLSVPVRALLGRDDNPAAAGDSSP